MKETFELVTSGPKHAMKCLEDSFKWQYGERTFSHVTLKGRATYLSYVDNRENNHWHVVAVKHRGIVHAYFFAQDVMRAAARAEAPWPEAPLDTYSGNLPECITTSAMLEKILKL